MEPPEKYNLNFTEMLYKTLILLILVSLNFKELSGQSIHYDYDESGNRVKRYIVLGKGNSSDENTLKEYKEETKLKESEEKTEEFEENLGELTIRIYPNPTQGQLYVEIDGLGPDETADYQLFSQTGLKLDMNKKTGYQFTVDMGTYTSGMYILRLMIRDEISQWKIFKE